MSTSTGDTVGKEIIGLLILAFWVSVPLGIYLAWPEGHGLHRYLMTCDDKGGQCQPSMHLRYVVFPEAQRVIEDTVDLSMPPEPLKQCVVVDENNWRCQNVLTFKAVHDGEWIGQDGFIGKDVPRYVWRLTVLRSWWDGLWK